jgi:hypothetical protein
VRSPAVPSLCESPTEGAQNITPENVLQVFSVDQAAAARKAAESNAEPAGALASARPVNVPQQQPGAASSVSEAAATAPSAAAGPSPSAREALKRRFTNLDQAAATRPAVSYLCSAHLSGLTELLHSWDLPREGHRRPLRQHPLLLLLLQLLHPRRHRRRPQRPRPPKTQCASGSSGDSQSCPAERAAPARARCSLLAAQPRHRAGQPPCPPA